MSGFGLSVLASQIEAVVINQGYPAVLEEYAAQPLLFQQFCEVIDSRAALTPNIGDKSTTLLSLARPVEIELGMDIPAASLEMGYSPQGKVRKFGRTITFTKEELEAAGSNAMNMALRRIEDTFPQWAAVWAAQKDEEVAGMLQKGTLTAGSTRYFKNTYTGNTATDGFIYDGLPAFDTAHPQSPNVTGTTFANHVVTSALTASNLQTQLTLMKSTNAKNGRGDQIVVTPRFLIVPPGLEYTAAEILESDLKAGTATNETNAVRTRDGLQLIVNPYLSDAASAASWWLTTGWGLRVMDSGAPMLSTHMNEQNDTVTVKGVGYFGAYFRDWRGWLAVNKAAS